VRFWLEPSCLVWQCVRNASTRIRDTAGTNVPTTSGKNRCTSLSLELCQKQKKLASPSKGKGTLIKLRNNLRSNRKSY
jgi:hypothetical protein